MTNEFVKLVYNMVACKVYQNLCQSVVLMNHMHKRLWFIYHQIGVLSESCWWISLIYIALDVGLQHGWVELNPNLTRTKKKCELGWGWDILIKSKIDLGLGWDFTNPNSTRDLILLIFYVNITIFF